MLNKKIIYIYIYIIFLKVVHCSMGSMREASMWALTKKMTNRRLFKENTIIWSDSTLWKHCGQTKHWTRPYYHGFQEVCRYSLPIIFVDMKCQAFYCDKQLFGCIICLHYVHFIWTYTYNSMSEKWGINVSLPFIPMPLSFFRNTFELKKTHHLIVAKFWCMNEIVNSIVNLAQICECIAENM
jgi:hypothetical protein